MWCELCGKWADDKHCASARHLNKEAWYATEQWVPPHHPSITSTADWARIRTQVKSSTRIQMNLIPSLNGLLSLVLVLVYNIYKGGSPHLI